MLAKTKTPDAQRRTVLGHLRTFRSRMTTYEARMAEDVKDGFSISCQRLAASPLDHDAARRRDLCAALTDSITLLREILAATATELVGFAPNTTGNSSVNQ